MNDRVPPSGLVLTRHALTRHAKRLRQLLADHGVALTATQSQEAFARVLGLKNWHEAHTLCAKLEGPRVRTPEASSPPNPRPTELPGPPAAAGLNWPRELMAHVRQMDQGLLIVTGETGVGKTTSLAALLREDRGRRPAAPAITMGTPVEYTYDSLAVIDRGLPSEEDPAAPTFQEGLKQALRRTPGTLLLGQCQDAETLQRVLEATQTGHRVCASFPATSIAQAFRDIIRWWNPSERRARWVDLVQSLRIILHLPPVTRDQDPPPTELGLGWDYLVLDEPARAEMLTWDPEEVPAKIEAWVQARVTRVISRRPSS